MPRGLNGLEEVEGFRAFLVNLWDGVVDSSLDSGLAAEYLDAIIARCMAGDLGSLRFRQSLRQLMLRTVFAAVARFQCRRAISGDTDQLLATFRGLDNLVDVIEAHAGLKDKLIKAGGAPSVCFNSSDSSPDVTADQCQLLAESINDVCAVTDEFFLAKDASSDGRKRLVWFTDVENLVAHLGQLPHSGDNTYACNIRNWLGLGDVHHGEHVFGFVSTVKDVCAAKLARPTVFDGIDHRWFKHLRALASYSDSAGRALNLDRLGTEVGPFDGGWEAVTPGPKFRDQFKCIYIGRINRPTVEYDEEAVLGAILKSASSIRTYADVVAALQAKIP